MVAATAVVVAEGVMILAVAHLTGTTDETRIAVIATETTTIMEEVMIALTLAPPVVDAMTEVVPLLTATLLLVAPLLAVLKVLTWW